MSGTRQDGILLVDDIDGGGGTGVAVSITEPIGSNTAADSLSVTLATDSPPLPITGTVAVTATDLDIRPLTFADDKVDVSGSTVTLSGTPTISGTVNQGNPNASVANSWPIKITDAVDTAQVHSANDTISTVDKGLLTQSIVQLKQGDGTVGAWVASPAYNVFASNQYPWVKAMRSSNLSGDTTFNALNAQVDIDLRERSFESVSVFIRNSNLIGTISFLTNPGTAGNVLQVYNVNTAQWVLGTVTNPTIDTLYMIPCAGLANLYVRVTAYTSGSALVTYSAGPGVGATYANVSGSHIKVSDGTDTANVGANASAMGGTPTKGLVVAGADASANVEYLLPIMNSNYTKSTTNTYAVSTDLRSVTWADGSSETRNEMLAVGGLGIAGATETHQKFVLHDGNTLVADPINTFGLQTRETGHSFATSGNISLLGARFTISSRYIVKTAAIFKLVTVGFTGTLRPVVSINNGTSWSYCQAVNIETGAVASTYVAGAVDGTYAIPFGNGATNYGFEVTTAGAGSVNCFVSANSNGQNSVFTLARPLAASTDTVTSNQGTPNTAANAWPVKITDGTDTVDVLPITGASGTTVNGLVTNSLIYGASTAGGGTYVEVKVNPSGALAIDGDVTVDNFPATQVVTATNLDIRDLVFATDKVDVSGSTVTTSGTATVSGTVAVSNFPATQPVSATNLDVRDLAFATDKVDVSGSSITTSGTATVSGTVSVSNFPVTQPISGSVSVSNFPATQPVSATDLDIRNLVFATDKVDVSGSSISVSGTATVSGSVSISNASGASAVNIQDGGNSITVDGSVSVSNFPSSQVVTATDLDIRNLAFAQDKVDASGSSISVSNFPSTQAVSATNLDIRDLVFSTDKVDVSGSSVTTSGTATVSGTVSVSNFPATQAVSATDLDIRNLVFATDKVDVSNSTVTSTPASATTCTQTQVPDSSTSVTILASNSNRRGASIVNTSTVTLYIRLSASAATTSNYTVALVATAYYEVPFNYTGTITGIWASAPGTGNANVSEFV